MFESHSEAIYELLRDEDRVDSARLADLRQESRDTGKPLADAVINHGLVEKPVLLAKIARHLGCAYVADPPAALPDEVVGLLPGSLARAYGVIPLRAAGPRLDLLASDPFDTQLSGELTFALDREVRLLVCDPARVEGLIRRHYGEDEARPADLPGEIDASEFPGSH